MASIKCGSCRERHASVDQVRACYGRGHDEGHAQTARPSAVRHDPTGPSAEQAPAQPRQIANGTYTVIFDGDDDAYRTLRLRDDFRTDGPDGAQVVEFLSGSDNELDFTGCAFLEGGWLRVWKRFRGGELQRELEEAVQVLLGTQDDERPGTDPIGEAREAYALMSGRCSACGRKLTVPASLHRGMGPDCAEKWGVA